MSAILRDVAVHAIVGNAPRIITVKAEATPPAARTFYGTGAPTTSTLATGNGKYNGVKSGYVVNASSVAAGVNYVGGDTMTLDDGCATEMQITVDMVDASGAIIDFHVSAIAVCTAYPSLPVNTTATTGVGAGATFNLNFPAPDYYIDITTPTAPVLYVCTKAGSYATAVWAQISGGMAGGVNGVIYDSTGATAYPAGTMAWVLTGFTLAGITVVPGVYLLMSGLSTPTSPTGNQIPQIPIPVSGTVYWMPVAAGLVVAGTCATGGSTQIYVNSTGQF